MPPTAFGIFDATVPPFQAQICICFMPFFRHSALPAFIVLGQFVEEFMPKTSRLL
jgi:hypothetical protein